MDFLGFLLRDAVHKRGTSRRPVSFCQSVRHTHVLYLNSLGYHKTFSSPGIQSFSFSGTNALTIFQGLHPERRSDLGFGRKNSTFSANVSTYLGNDTRQGRSYYGTLTGKRMFSVESCHFMSDLERSC